ncbi:MAG: hypothetical protein JW808_06695 [Victivallales bacterium]|nr:hypothetical protein [Victivallales bacterium]
MGRYRKAECIKEAGENRKTVAYLLHTGNVRGTSARKSSHENIRRNRVLMLILAVLLLSAGIYGIFF